MTFRLWRCFLSEPSWGYLLYWKIYQEWWPEVCSGAVFPIKKEIRHQLSQNQSFYALERTLQENMQCWDNLLTQTGAEKNVPIYTYMYIWYIIYYICIYTDILGRYRTQTPSLPPKGTQRCPRYPSNYILIFQKTSEPGSYIHHWTSTKTKIGGNKISLI